MTITTNGKFKRLVPESGQFLTQSSIENEYVRTFCKEVCIPLNSNESAWTEWSQAQKERWEEEHPETEDEGYGEDELE